MKQVFCLLSLLLCWSVGISQETFPVNGVHNVQNLYYAFTNANIYTGAQDKPIKGTLLVYDGKITAVGPSVTIPAGAIINDCAGFNIYPSFVDPYAGFNAKPLPKKKKGQIEPSTELGHWNPAIRPQHQFKNSFPVDQKVQDDWLACGIGVVSTHSRDGIMRGEGEIFHVGIDHPNDALISVSNALYYSLDKGSSNHDYPSSHMGAIALFRQTLYDAQWYITTGSIKETNPALKALSDITSHSNIFELNNALSYRNVQSLASEFDLDFILKGTGKEYLIKDQLRPRSRLILPVYVPKAYNIQDPLDARLISLEDLKHWEAAPFNPRLIRDAGHLVGLTRDTIKSGKEFLGYIQKIGQTGLSHGEVLEMLTKNPASFLGIDAITGTLEQGKLANFFIASSEIVKPDFFIIEHWNIGKRVYKSDKNPAPPEGVYNIVIDSIEAVLTLSTAKDELKAQLTTKDPAMKWKVKAKMERELVTLVITDEENGALKYQLSGKLSLKGGIVDGTGTNADGEWISWAGIKERASKASLATTTKTDTTSEQNTPPNLPEIWFPNKAFGWAELPTSKNFVITNAHVWTCTDNGMIEACDVWVENGKIKAVGKGMLFPTELRRIDAKGRHLTPGLIDEHSHIALRGGVNEWARSSSAEVRMDDSVDPWSIQIYRQLAGGVTCAQLLHGSANPIGGQSAIVKLKWGASAEEMLLDDAPKFIKFALGENVKRSNSSDPKDRFPLTRMGVEQSYVDAFTRAVEYRSSQLRLSTPSAGKRINTPVTAPLVRKDLQLDALVEILADDRFISCHSYVASEILMLIGVADSLGFRVNTFTHILEGYKVAPELAQHKAYGSTFSDWWAYKFEVNDAIPYNAALMTKAGITVAINSDDAEMGRRLNQEAAKTMKYGELTEVEALNMVTINPAKMLHIDDRVGSIEVGKDADLVLWSDHPLSVYTHVARTFIEGVEYFNEDDQPALLRRVAEERMRIIALMIEDSAATKRAITAKKELHYHCDTVLEDYIAQ